MRLKGKKIEGLNVIDVFIPRMVDGEAADLHFKAQAVVDYKECDALNPAPNARKMRTASGEMKELRDSAYDLALDQYARKRTDYLVIKSLQATEELEWETVNINDVDTWGNWRKELEDSGITAIEIGRIFNGVCEACGLDDSKVEAARERFLVARRAESERLSSQKDEASNTRSGELASDSE